MPRRARAFISRNLVVYGMLGDDGTMERKVIT